MRKKERKKDWIYVMGVLSERKWKKENEKE